MPSFTSGQYLPPGVYVEEQATSLVTVQTIAPTVVAIAGPGIGYRVNTEAVTLTGTTGVALAKDGIITASGFQVSGADGTVYALTTDFTRNQTGTAPNNTTTIARVNGGGITDGATVYVTYHYTDADYAQPQRFQNYEDVKDAYGEPIDLLTGAVTSPLSLAAKVAFENGARQLVIVATPDSDGSSTTQAHLAAALTQLEAYSDVNVVVVLPVGLTVQSDVQGVGGDLKNHVERLVGDNLYRVGLVGFEPGATTAPDTLAAAFPSSRVMMAYPNRLSYYNGYTNSMIEVGGEYLAAAYAGILANQSVQLPLTKKLVRSFAGFPASMAATMTTANKNTWSSSGVAVAEINRNGQMVVRHGVTTDPTSVLTRELSLVRAKDALIDLIYGTIDAGGLIGAAIDAETPIRIQGVISGCLEAAVNADMIVAYNGLSVRQQSVDPSVIEAKFQYQPAYPLNYILISFSINTVTGATTLNPAA
jgi:hypothetical protein